MHLEVRVAINFIVSHLYNKLPRRRADMFAEELEQILLSRFEGHWYPDAPLRGSAYRCLHLGFIRDPVVELAAERSGLHIEEVRANFPEEMTVWIDPYEVSWRIGDKGDLKVMYLDKALGLGSEGEMAEGVMSRGDLEADKVICTGLNPEAQFFLPIGNISPVFLPSLTSSPIPLSTSCCQGLYGYSASSSPTNLTTHSSNTSTPSPPIAGPPYLQAQQQQHFPVQPNFQPQPIVFTPAVFAATKFGSVKMRMPSSTGPTVVRGVGMPVQPAQTQMHSSPTMISSSELLKHKSLTLSLASRAGSPMSSQLSPNAKEFAYPSPKGHFHCNADTPTLPPHTSPFQAADRRISEVEKSKLVEELTGCNLQYSNQPFQPVVLVI